jgi:hypothetical protein
VLLGTVSTLAGSGSAAFADGTGVSASFSCPGQVAVDSVGDVLVADAGNSRIRKVSPAGVVTTGVIASLNSPEGVAVDSARNEYMSDTGNHRIRVVSPVGVVTTLAGSGSAAFADGTGTSASFFGPSGVAVDSAGNVYVADVYNHRIRVVSPVGVVTTLAGSGSAAFADGTGVSASFNSPYGVAVDNSGNVYVADRFNHRIRVVSPVGVVTTLAGSGSAAFADGTGVSASFNSPVGVALDSVGSVYVADAGNNRIRMVNPAGVVTTLAGSGAASFADGTGVNASFDWPVGIALDSAGNVYVGDCANHRIRMIV